MGIRRLLSGPVGPGSTFTVLAAAQEAMRQGSRFTLVLPTQAAREHARNELARRTGRCDPRAAFTFVGLARHLLGPNAPRLASSRERDAHLVGALWGAALPEHELALRFRGFRQALLYAFDEVEANGLTPAGLERKLRQARLDPPRVERLVSAFQGYRQRLRAARLATGSDLLHLAVEALGRGGEQDPGQVPQLLLVDGFMDLSPRQIEFLDALARRVDEVVVTWPTAEEGAQSPAFEGVEGIRHELVARYGFLEEPRPRSQDEEGDARPAVLQRIARDLFCEELAEEHRVSDVQGLRVVRAASRRDEVAYALARARDYVTAVPGRRWTDVLVIVPQIRKYRREIERVASELGVPVRVRGPLQLAASPLVQAVLSFLRGVAGFELGALLSAASSPVFGLLPDEADRLARAARRRGLPSGGEPGLWGDLARELGGAAGALVRHARELGEGLRDTLAQDPSSESGGRLLRRSLEQLLCPVAPALLSERPTPEEVAAAAAEVSARQELLALLGDLERLALPLHTPGTDPAPLDLVARIEEEIRATDYRPRDQRRHVLHVVDARDARAWEADVVFVLGLVEREFPRLQHDDLFLPEGTRRALTGRRGRGRGTLQLRTAQDRAAAERFLFYAAATRARKQLWLLYPGFDANGNPRRGSRFLDTVSALVTAEAWEEARLLRTPSDLVANDPQELLTPTCVRRFAYRRLAAVSRPTGPEAEKVELATALFQSLLQTPPERARAQVALKRAEPSLEEPLGAEAALEHVYSASELEAYAACPFRHFVHYVLNVRAPDDLAQSGLDTRRQGIVVHQALQQIYAEGASPQEALATAFAEGARALDIGLEEEAFRRQALAAIQGFLRDDQVFREATGLQPWEFEKAFGPRSLAGPLKVEAPELGGTIQLQGAIDRVDLLAAGDDTAPAGFVTDYKVGGREVDGAYLDLMHKGERLQVPIYLLALQRVFGIRPLGATFAALATRRRTGVVEPQVGEEWGGPLDGQQGVRLHRVPLQPTLDRTEEHIRRYVGGIAQGLIDPLPREASECDRCQARDVCRLDPWEARRRARRGRALPLERMRPGPPARPAPSAEPAPA